MVDPADADVVSDALWQWGPVAIEESTVTTDEGPRTRLRTSVGRFPEETRALLAARFPGAIVDSVEVPKSVSESWRDHAQPTWVDGSHVLVPAWCPAPDAKVVVRIEPGDQFGLGNHDTTVLAARLLLDEGVTGSRWLDLGCGSGVLSVLAVVSRGVRMVATDISPGSHRVVQENVILNGLARESVSWVDSIRHVGDASCDGVVANILAPVLRDLAREVRRVTVPGGRVIVSGLLKDQVREVVDAYRPCSVVHQEFSGVWTAVVLRLETPATGDSGDVP